MIVPGVPDLVAAAGAGLLVAAGGAFVAGYKYALSTADDPEDDFDDVDGLEEGEGFEAPKYGGKGALGTLLTERKKRGALKNGYVRWHLIGSSFSSPKYVKPEQKAGGNMPELKHRGETYYFDMSASVPSEEEGVPVFVHRDGESDPVNLRDGWEHAVKAKTLTEYLELRVTSSPPDKSLLGGLLGGWNAMTVFRYGLLAIIAIFVGIQTLGGGLY